MVYTTTSELHKVYIDVVTLNDANMVVADGVALLPSKISQVR